MPLLRPLLTLLIVLVTFASSGISSAIASSMSDDENDCCGEKGESDKRDEGPSERDRCPPLCHACACSPTFSVPPVLVAVELIREIDAMSPSDSVKQPPASPPGPGVFHPPRVSVRA
jgi:hypothetical protein